MPGSFEAGSSKKQSSLLGNVFNKLGSSKKKTPARSSSKIPDGKAGDVRQTKRTLFSPFSPSRLPKSQQKTGGRDVVSRVSPVRLFGGGAGRQGGASVSDGLIPARHAEASSCSNAMASSIRVVVRVRPRSGKEREVGVSVREGEGEGEGEQDGGRRGSDVLTIQSGSGESMTFGFDRVLGADKDQQDVYNVSGRGVVENCLQGFNGCLLAYGQTGSGKTYSMMGDGGGGGGGGDADAFHSRGIIQRSFEDLFSKIEAKKEQLVRTSDQRLECSVSCSFIEIYNETVSDLTNPEVGNLTIRDDPGTGVFVEGVQWHQVRSVRDVRGVLAMGMANRRVAETMANDRSSRSHSVFTATIEQRIGEALDNNTPGNARNPGTVLRSRLHLVDLAGSERQKASGAVGERLKEASNINKSLSALGHVIMTLVDVQQGKKRHVPYRDSKLTFLLQDALGGTAKTVLLATVSPAMSNSFETLSTLRFADNVKRIKNKAVIHQDATGDAESLRNEVVRLRQLLADAMSGRVQDGGFDNVSASKDIHGVNGTEEAMDLATLSDHGASQKALVAALTREERACREVASLKEELSALQGLVDAKESDLQRTKMMLRLKESRVTHVGGMTIKSRHDEERARLESEIALLKEKIDAHPDVKKFALENIRLRRQLDLVAEGASVALPDDTVSAEEFGQLRSELLAMTSRAEKLLNEVQTLRAEATASKVLRTAEKKRRGSIDLGAGFHELPHQHERGPQSQPHAHLQAELDDLRLLVETQRAKVSEFDRMCAHAGTLDSTVETLTSTCADLRAECDDWYAAYTESLQEIVAMWSIQADMRSSLESLEESIAEERVRHNESNERAKQRISEAMKAATQLNDELQSQGDRIACLEQELNVARTDATEGRAAAEELEHKCRSQRAEISEMHALVARYSEQVEIHASTAEALGRQLATLQSEHHTLAGEAARKEKELKSTQAALAAAQIDAQMATSQTKEKSKQLAFSEERESELRATIISLQDELALTRADADSMHDEQIRLVDELRDELAASKAAYSRLIDQASSVETLKKEKAALQARIKTLEGTLNENLKNTNGNATAGPMGQEAQARNYNNIAQKLADAEEKMTTMHQEAHALKAQLKSRDDALAKLRNQMAMEVSDAAQHVQELLAAQARADRLERQLSALLDGGARSHPEPEE